MFKTPVFLPVTTAGDRGQLEALAKSRAKKISSFGFLLP